MKTRPGFSLVIVSGLLLTLAGPAAGQTAPVAPFAPSSSLDSSPNPSPSANAIPRTADQAGTIVKPLLTKRSFSETVGHDVHSFFSGDTARIVGTFAIAGLAASHWDHAAVDEAGERMSQRTFSIGNLLGGLYVQTGAGAVTYLLGKTTKSPQIVSLGSELVRAQLLSQMFVQGTKFAIGRQRPDGSNSQSFPSGHTASSFATATVLQQHFGWKAGAPAYALAGFVGASRMAADKHYLSDVLVGAGIGIAAGRTVSFKFGGERFAVGAAPTVGGAMVTFTKK
jgi:membrane-associated phospholipid phosphatase